MLISIKAVLPERKSVSIVNKPEWGISNLSLRPNKNLWHFSPPVFIVYFFSAALNRLQRKDIIMKKTMSITLVSIQIIFLCVRIP